jgi:hypothetical protein
MGMCKKWAVMNVWDLTASWKHALLSSEAFQVEPKDKLQWELEWTGTLIFLHLLKYFNYKRNLGRNMFIKWINYS